MGHDAERAEDDYWENQVRAEREAALEDWVDGNMTPAQHAGYGSETMTEHGDDSPKEGHTVNITGDPFYGPLEAQQEYEAHLAAQWEREWEHRDGDPTYLGAPGTEPKAAQEERVRQARLLNRLKGVMAGWGIATATAMEVKATVEELSRLQEWAAARLAQMTKFPAEPEVGNGPCVITFTRTYAGRTFTYAALRVPAGREAGTWVVTGPKSPAYVTWDQLMVWVERGTPSDQRVVVHAAAEWDTITAPS